MKRLKWPRRLIAAIVLGALLGVAGFGWLIVMIAYMEDTIPTPPLAAVASAGADDRYGRSPYAYDCIIVLGAQVKSIGIPSEALYRRMNLALDYYKARPAVVIATGGQGLDEPMAEGDYIADWLRRSGVDGDMLAVDNTSRNTKENVSHAKSLMEQLGLTRALVITSDYHLPRALTICREQGVDAIGAGSESSPSMWWNNHFRESLSWIKYRLGL